MPFDLNLPIGIATVFDGEQHVRQPTPLPASFEIREDQLQDHFQPRGEKPPEVKAKTFDKLKDGLKRKLDQQKHIGVWYYLTFEYRDGTPPQETAEMPIWRDAKKNNHNMIKIPLVFLGEASASTRAPSLLPPTLPPSILLEPGSSIGEGWGCHTGKARWSKANYTGAKRNLQIEVSRRMILSQDFPLTMICYSYTCRARKST